MCVLTLIFSIPEHQMIQFPLHLIFFFNHCLKKIFIIKYSLSVPPAVKNLTNTASDAQWISLQWQRPGTLCDITSYFICYDGAAMWGDNNTQAGCQNMTVINDTNPVTYDLTGLVPYSSYSVKVWAETSAGNGTIAPPLDGLTTLEDCE